MSTDEGQLMDYCVQRATVMVQQTCAELLYVVRDTILPMYSIEESYDGKPESLKVTEQVWESIVFYKKMLADYFRYLAEAEG